MKSPKIRNHANLGLPVPVTLRRGQTPGKMLVGIRVVRQDRTPADWMTLFVREGLKAMLYLMPMGIIFDFFITMSDPDRQCSLPDRFTGTMVVRSQAHNP
ncbi:MAG: RDD family protein [Chloroflexi bacterium]|nr:RDD family protein [Chloroflexota bacterium]